MTCFTRFASGGLYSEARYSFDPYIDLDHICVDRRFEVLEL